MERKKFHRACTRPCLCQNFALWTSVGKWDFFWRRFFFQISWTFQYMIFDTGSLFPPATWVLFRHDYGEKQAHAWKQVHSQSQQPGSPPTHWAHICIEHRTESFIQLFYIHFLDYSTLISFAFLIWVYYCFHMETVGEFVMWKKGGMSSHIPRAFFVPILTLELCIQYSGWAGRRFHRESGRKRRSSISPTSLLQITYTPTMFQAHTLADWPIRSWNANTQTPCKTQHRVSNLHLI